MTARSLRNHQPEGCQRSPLLARAYLNHGAADAANAISCLATSAGSVVEIRKIL